MNKLYPVQWWLVTLLLVAPLNYILTLLFHDKRNFEILLWVIPFSLLFSLPALAIVYVLFKVLARLRFPVPLVKILLVVAATVAMAITLRLVSGSMINEIGRIYAVSLALSSLLVKLKADTQQPA